MPSKMSSTNQLGKNWRSNSGSIHVFPLSNDLDDWRKLSNVEKDLVGKVFGGLTLLDTMQSETGSSPSRDIRTPHEEAVFNNIQFMESVHAKSYSSIFSTLNTKAEIEEIFEWTNTNPYLQKKAEIVNEIYLNGSPLEKKVAAFSLKPSSSTQVSSPLYYLGNNKLANVAEIIKIDYSWWICSRNLHWLQIPTWFQWITWRRARKTQRMDVRPGLHSLRERRRLYREPLWQCWLDRRSQNLPSLQCQQGPYEPGTRSTLPRFSWWCQPNRYERYFNRNF